MRLSVKAISLLGLFLTCLPVIEAEPLVKGYFLSKSAAISPSQPLEKGKGLVLAHVLNQSEQAVMPGNYEIGVEVKGEGKITTYALAPKTPIDSNVLKTFRMAVPLSESDKKNGKFRVFSKIGNKITWSEFSDFSGEVARKFKDEEPQKIASVPFQPVEETASGIKQVTLYSAPEPFKVAPPPEIPFENKKSAQKAAKQEEKADKAAEKAGLPNIVKTQSIKAPEKTAKVEPKAVAKAETATKAEKAKVAVVSENKPVAMEEVAKAVRNIDPNEFKKLRTIDEELVIYVIKDGDTLNSIAEKYYGSAGKARVIADLNFIERSSSVRVGEEIIVDVKPLGKRG
ncbi:MAG: LysM peptidoglycan-binding domain-containing protein [Candidatus Riflebacteria bacterium]|nr:LysM peptidoglycan-binding domain-containing protein [Candidatus Riflebacteria bacterium]